MLTTINKDNMNNMNKQIGDINPDAMPDVTGNQALFDGPLKPNFSEGMAMKSPLKQNAFIGAMRAAKESGESTFEVGGKEFKVKGEGSPLTNKDKPRKEARTLAGKNFKSERRMAGFAEDTESNKARFESPRVKTKINKKDITKNIKKS